MTRRGAALLHTLILLLLLTVVAFTLAASTMSQLHFTQRFHERSQADQVARAAVTEFLLALEQKPQSRVSDLPEPLLDGFTEGQQLLHPSPHLDGQARLQKSRCTDNSGGRVAVPGYFGSQVPPYSLSLVYEVNLGRRTYVYESLLQQRWRYAVAAPGPILVCGRLGLESPPPSLHWTYRSDFPPRELWAAPSRVEGKVLGWESDCIPLSDRFDVFSSGVAAGPTRIPVVPVSQAVYQSLYPFAWRGGLGATVGDPGNPHLTTNLQARYDNHNRVSVGGDLDLSVLYQDEAVIADPERGGEVWKVKRYPQETRGAVLDGNVDLVENFPRELAADAGRAREQYLRSDPTVVVAPGNSHLGAVRASYRPGHGDPASRTGRTRTLQLFQRPDLTGWPAAPHPQTDAEGIVVGRPVKFATHGPETLLLPDGRGVLSPNRGMLVCKSAHGTAFSLQGVSLAVDGDLYLYGYRLEGSDATLVVNGTLVIDGGDLDAGGNGLVVYCKRLVMRAEGTFRGLLVVEQGACLYGSDLRPESERPVVPDEPLLTIEGGLLVGGSQLILKHGEPTESMTSEAYKDGISDLGVLEMSCLTLVSARIKYDPQYLRSLNRYGPFEVLATELRQ